MALGRTVYGPAVFGYITGQVLGRDAEARDAPVAGGADIQRLTEEVRELRLRLACPDR
ncbi:MAG: hypothetical protein ACK4VY_09750 [Brevundimonas sp.]